MLRNKAEQPPVVTEFQAQLMPILLFETICCSFQIKPCSASACADIQSSHADIQFRLIFSANNTVETILLPVSQSKADHRGRGVQPFTIIENKR